MAQLLILLLSLNLVIAYFMPPLSVMGRNFFIGDWLPAIWLPIAFYLNKDSLRALPIRKILGVFAVIAIALFHGKFRPQITTLIDGEYVLWNSTGSRVVTLAESDRFNFTRELVIATRFALWFVALACVYAWRDRLRRLAGANLRWISLLVLVIGLCSLFFRLDEFNKSAGNVYWSGRSHGVFQSPLEGCVAIFLLCLSIGASLDRTQRQRFLPGLLGSAAMAAALLTKTLTPAFALLLASAAATSFSSIDGGKIKQRVPWAGLGIFISALVTVGLVIWTYHLLPPSLTEFLSVKQNSVFYRLDHWQIMVRKTLGSWDQALFGLGFIPIHTDQSLLFIFTRAGFLGLGLALFLIYDFFKRHWNEWQTTQRVFATFVLMLGLTLDAWFYRHLILTLICTAVVLSFGTNSLDRKRRSA